MFHFLFPKRKLSLVTKSLTQTYTFIHEDIAWYNAGSFLAGWALRYVFTSILYRICPVCSSVQFMLTESSISARHFEGRH